MPRKPKKPAKPHKWSEEAVAYLKEHALKATDKELALALTLLMGRPFSRVSVIHQRNILGLTRKTRGSPYKSKEEKLFPERIQIKPETVEGIIAEADFIMPPPNGSRLKKKMGLGQRDCPGPAAG